MKEEFLALLRKTNREGIEELINFLEKSDFFVAPASTRFHGNFEGGLAAHSMKVYEILKHKVENSVIDVEIKEESIILIGLLHDICKTNFYKVDYRNAKNALGVWEKVPYYTVDDTIPYGHGEKSVMMITEYIKLTPEEKYSIRWHMGYTEPKENYNAIGATYKKYPIALLTKYPTQSTSLTFSFILSPTVIPYRFIWNKLWLCSHNCSATSTLRQLILCTLFFILIVYVWNY